MSPKKTNRAGGVITFHTPFHVRLFKSEDCMEDVESRKRPSQPSERTRSTSTSKGDEASSPSGPQQGSDQDRLSHTSLRRMQAKMEAENQQVAKEIIQPLLDTENGFLKELERFLSRRDVTELRRRELLHKRWTEHVWRVEEHVAVKRSQSSYTKLSAADSVQLKRTARSCEAGCKYTRRQVESQSESVTSQASSHHPVTASRKTVEDQTEWRKSGRLDTIPYHIRATVTLDGRCHETGCRLNQPVYNNFSSGVHQNKVRP